MTVALAAAFALALCLPGKRLKRADLVFNNGGEVSSLDPAMAYGAPEGRLVRALFEGLLTRNWVTLAPEPAMAESFTVSPDGLVYTFQMRPQARWSNGDPVTAHDFAWNFRRVLEPETGSPFAQELWCVRGAKAFNTGLDEQGQAVARDWNQVGIRAQDDSTLSIELHQPVRYFLDLLACYQLAPVNPRVLEDLQKRFPDTWRSQWSKPENLVVNGPYRLGFRRVNDRIRLEKNLDYWDADQVALRTIDVLALDRASTALNLYAAGDIDWLDGTIPALLVRRLIQREDFNPQFYCALYFYRVNTTKPPLDDKRVRRALCLTIERSTICDRMLRAGQRPCFGLIPWGQIADYVSPQGPREDLALARRLLRQAGFGAGARALPELEILFDSSETHREIAEVIADRWQRNLGVDVKLRSQEWESYIDNQANLDYDISRSSWISDYLDPLTFFKVFTSNSENNRTGWKNAQYDQLVESAAREADPATRNSLLQQAESILLDEVPILPIYSYTSQNLLNPRVGGLVANLLNDYFPKHWYWMDDRELDAVRRMRTVKKQRVDAHGSREGLYSPAAQNQRLTSGKTR